MHERHAMSPKRQFFICPSCDGEITHTPTPHKKTLVLCPHCGQTFPRSKLFLYTINTSIQQTPGGPNL